MGDLPGFRGFLQSVLDAFLGFLAAFCWVFVLLQLDGLLQKCCRLWVFWLVWAESWIFQMLYSGSTHFTHIDVDAEEDNL